MRLDLKAGPVAVEAPPGAPACKGFEYRFGDLVGCSHMSGLFVRRIRPLALTEFADWIPIKIAR